MEDTNLIEQFNKAVENTVNQLQTLSTKQRNLFLSRLKRTHPLAWRQIVRHVRKFKYVDTKTDDITASQ